MKVDLSGMINSIKEEVNEREASKSARESSGSNYPLVYPIHKGKLTVRLLYNVKSNSIMRRVVRHQGEKFKVPCLTSFEGYEGGCPVCDTINEIETTHGKEIGVSGKYGRNEKFIAYAKIIDGDSAYFNDEKGPKKGDIVILMFPWMVYNAIQGIMVEAGENANKIVAENEGLPLVIENTGSRPLYNVYVFPYGAQKAYATDEEFDNMLMDLPDIRETIVPRMLTEKDQTDARALADTIRTQYMSNVYVQPTTVPQQPMQPQVPVADPNVVQQTVTQVAPPVQPVATVTVDQVPNTVPQAVPSATGKPECFGHHDMNNNKCILCPNESECMMLKQ